MGNFGTSCIPGRTLCCLFLLQYLTFAQKWDFRVGFTRTIFQCLFSHDVIYCAQELREKRAYISGSGVSRTRMIIVMIGVCSCCGECDFADCICMRSTNPDFVIWDTTHGRIDWSDLGQEVNSGVSRKYVSSEVTGKKEDKGERRRWGARVKGRGRDKGRENTPELLRQEKMKRTVPRNVMLSEIEGKKES